MRQKNNCSRFWLLMALLLLTLSVLSGCSGSTDPLIEKEVNPAIDVFGIKLFMDEQKAIDAIGSQVEKAMCVYGYEYDYPGQRINIGFNAETGKVRRVTTKNQDTSIYGIKPGTELAVASDDISSHGYVQDEKSKYRFTKENIIFSIISMKGTHADGLTIEINPDQP